MLAGWSRGGRAAAAVAVRPEAVGGWRPLGAVCLGAAYTRAAPTTGGSPIEDLAATGAAPVPFWLVHGTQDTVVPVEASREFAALLAEKGWPVRFEEQPTDHAGVIGTNTTGRQRPPRLARSRRRRGQAVGRIIAEAAHLAAEAPRPPPRPRPPLVCSVPSSAGGVPITDIVILLIGLPLVAAVGGWLFAGREPPAIARQPIE